MSVTRGSRAQGRNDMKKFDKARDLKKILPSVRTKYQESMRSKEVGS